MPQPQRLDCERAPRNKPLTPQQEIAELRKENRNLRRKLLEAGKDPLTNIESRRGFNDKAQLVLGSIWSGKLSRRTPKRAAAVLFLDVDNLKWINENLKHRAGDQALREIARFLRSKIRPGQDVLARISGDEFVIIFNGASAHDVLRKFQENKTGDPCVFFRTNLCCDGKERSVIISLSGGITDYRQNEDVWTTIDRAENGLRAMKRLSKGCIQLVP